MSTISLIESFILRHVCFSFDLFRLAMLLSSLPFKRFSFQTARYVHQSVKEGFKDADSYEKARPGYAPEAMHWILDQIEPHLYPPFRFLELGSGTGKFTTQFLPLLNSHLTNPEREEHMRTFYVNNHPSFYGVVEPMESMASVLRKWDFEHWAGDQVFTADSVTSSKVDS